MKKYQSPTAQSVGGANDSISIQSLIKMAYAVIAGAGVALVAVALAGVAANAVYAVNWKWCDPYWE